MAINLNQLKTSLHQEGIFFIFCGPISYSLVTELVEMLEARMEKSGVPLPVASKVFAVVLEQLQNIFKYSDEVVLSDNEEEEDKFRVGVITVALEAGKYVVSSGNQVFNHKLEHLSETLKPLQSMDRDMLRVHHREQRRKATPEGHHGARLGLIHMARKASAPIEYEIDPVNDQLSFFTLKITI